MKQTKGAIPNIIEKTVKYIEEKGTHSFYLHQSSF